MGARGPKPMPNADRLAPHAGRQLDAVPASAPVVDSPPADGAWHPEVQVWFESLARSPQAAEYTRADWGHASASAAIMSGAMIDGDWATAHRVLADTARALMTTRPARLAARLDIDERAPAPVVELPTNDQIRQRLYGDA